MLEPSRSLFSVLRAGTKALGILKPEIFVIYAEYLVSLLCEADPVAGLLRGMHWRVR